MIQVSKKELFQALLDPGIIEELNMVKVSKKELFRAFLDHNNPFPHYVNRRTGKIVMLVANDQAAWLLEEELSDAELAEKYGMSQSEAASCIAAVKKCRRNWIYIPRFAARVPPLHKKRCKVRKEHAGLRETESRFPPGFQDRNLCKEPLRHCVLAIDQTGVGAGVVDMLRKAQPTAKLKRVLITSGHSVSWVDGVCHVPKKELVASVQVVLQGRRITIPTNLMDAEVLEKELLAFRAKITAASNVVFEAWRERDHDDLVLALAMAVFFAERAPLPCTQGPMHFSLPRKGRFIFPRGR